MSQKITIEKEIENIKNYLNEAEDIDPDYMGRELKEIQNYAIITHGHAERCMETLILKQIKNQIEKTMGEFKKAEDWYPLHKKLEPLLESLSYREKLSILEDHYWNKSNSDELIKSLKKSLKKVNKLRNEFAHPKGMKLRNKYNYQTNKGKQNVRDLYRAFEKVRKDLNNYFSKFLSKKNN